MQMLSATAAHRGKIECVVIKECQDINQIIVTDPDTERDFLLYPSAVTRAEIIKFVDRNKLTEAKQLIGITLRAEPVNGRSGPIYYWRPERTPE